MAAVRSLAVVPRHNPVLRAFDTGSPLSVGNGEFAFTVDATGLLGTLSQWGWQSAPNPEGWSIERLLFTEPRRGSCAGRALLVV
jgi:hypothetical protein